MIPPDVWLVAGVPLPGGMEELSDYGETVVVPQLLPGIVGHSVLTKSSVVLLEKRDFENPSLPREPEEGHHVSEVLWCEIDEPRLPVDDANGVCIRIARVENVADMDVFVDNSIGSRHSQARVQLG